MIETQSSAFPRLNEPTVVIEPRKNALFFSARTELFLDCSGFNPLRLGVFPEFDRDPDTTTWNVVGLARAA